MSFRSSASIGIAVALVASSGGVLAQQATPKRNYAQLKLEQQTAEK